MCLGMDFLEFILLDIDEHFQSVYSCHQIWKILRHYVFKRVLFFIYVSHFFWAFSVPSIRSFSVVLQATKALFTFFNHFSVVGLIFFLNDVSFILKLIDSLLCHSHCVTELIYGVVFVLFLSFRVSVWFFFISSISLLSLPSVYFKTVCPYLLE